VSHTVLPPSVLWRNRETKAYWFGGPNQEIVVVILRPKSLNHDCRF
jgi:hypothetical protein